MHWAEQMGMAESSPSRFSISVSFLTSGSITKYPLLNSERYGKDQRLEKTLAYVT